MLLYPQEILDGLRAKNHTVVGSSNFAVVGSIRNRCSIVKSTDVACIEAVSDGRKGGTPDGYVSQTDTLTTIAIPTMATTSKFVSSANSEKCTGVLWLTFSAVLLIREHL